MSTISLILSSFFVIYVARRVIAFRKAVKAVEDVPGSIIPIAAETTLGMVIRQIPGLCSILGLSVGSNFVQEWGHDVYQDGWDVKSLIAMWPVSNIFIFLADAAAVKEVTTYRSRFPKPVIFYEPLAFFGKNIVVSEGEVWKKYRKISAPAFTELAQVRSANYGSYKSSVYLPMLLGFGQSISWTDDDDIPEGHTMSFKDTMQIMSKDFIIPIAIPKWALGITKRTRKAGQALVELKKYMSEMIHGRLHSEKVERADLFSLLLEENSQHLDSAALTDDELFVPQTTSHTMAFALGLLALYPDEQEKLLQHTKSVLSDGRAPTYGDLNSLTYALAVFYETLRLYPPVSIESRASHHAWLTTNVRKVGAIPKTTTEDTSVNITNAEGQVKRVPLPKGTYIDIHIAAIHKNPRYWSDPKTFKPARFLEPNWPRDAFLPFSAGSRACLGRRFAEIEAIAALTLFVLKYKITVKEEPQFAHETFEERKARVMASDCGISLT
ncbi:hypothetical protein CVT24_008570 [Panaeolus cyanescens]|uniref:Cytochrome P450 n=1 Tax=Panaeolus cyanescens TaxID=181874 RepID=A0A409VKS3_9AGAR|nr:hypothetical protein CVT24_008570 [Panaeolus cyanescens]